MTSMFASVSHTAVSCLWDAMHINSSSGPAGRDNSVMSLGKEVTERKNSLSAYKLNTVISLASVCTSNQTHVRHARICRP